MRSSRFILRTLMVGIIACGLLFWWIRCQGSPSYALVVALHSIVTWGLCLFTAFSLARTFGPTVRGRGRGAVAWLLLILVLPALLYLNWAHHPVARGDWSDLIHGFPYPDRAINALERWFDARHPVTTPDLDQAARRISPGRVRPRRFDPRHRDRRRVPPRPHLEPTRRLIRRLRKRPTLVFILQGFKLAPVVVGPS